MADVSRNPREHWLKPLSSKNKVAKSGYTIISHNPTTRTPPLWCKSSYQKPANHFSRSLIIGGEAVTEDPSRSPLTNKQRANEQRQPNPRSCFGEIQSHPNSLVLIVAIDPNARVVSIVIDAELQQTLRLHHHLPNRTIPNQPPL